MCDLCAQTQTFDPARHNSGDSAAIWQVSNLPLPGGGDEEPTDGGTTPTPLPTGTLDELASYLTTGFWADNDEDERSFADVIGNSSNHVITVDLTALTAAGQRLARWAMETWEQVADVQFTEVLSGGDITFDDNQDGAFVTYDSGDFGRLHANLNVSTAWLQTYGTGLESYSFSTFVHELGHTLGLGHMGNYNGDSGSASWANDSYQVSVMSYIPQDQNPNVDASLALAAGPMIADILAVQALYGTSDASTGDTTWGVNGAYSRQFASLLSGADDPIAFAIYDTDGETDLIDLSPSSTNDRLDLTTERFSDIGGLIGNVAMARGTSIENAKMGSGDDTVLGNGADNKIWGGGGKDHLYGGEGQDRLIGGGKKDWLYGGSENDRLMGKNGRDFLDSGEGNDVMIGGNGRDRFFYGFGHDRDRIKDFTLGEDRLVFSGLDFGSQDAAGLLDSYGEVTGKGIRLDFGASATSGADANDRLILIGVFDLDALADDIIFV